MTLCFSRYSYYEIVLDQTVPTFLGAIRRGFEDFGGAPARIKPDNLKSAVLISALGERYYQEDFFRLCQHYGTLPDAARPLTPTDKGRTERDIGYVKGSCFQGRDLKTIEEAREWLARWRREVALVRVHGTTRRRPLDLFEEERSALRPLPSDAYEVTSFSRHKVRKDCHVHVLSNYYSVPHAFVGTTVTVRTSEDRVDVYADGERVATHQRLRGRGASRSRRPDGPCGGGHPTCSPAPGRRGVWHPSQSAVHPPPLRTGRATRTPSTPPEPRRRGIR